VATQTQITTNGLQSTNTANGVINTNTPPVAPGAVPNATVETGLNGSTRLQTGATPDLTVGSRPVGVGVSATTPAPNTTISVGGDISSAMNSAATLRDLNTATFATRDTVLTQVDARLDNARRATAELQRNSRNLSAEARTRFDAAYSDVEAREAALRRSENDARQASSSNWAQAQARLAADYDAYVQAVARAEAAAR
jgi:hypothetical protein